MAAKEPLRITRLHSLLVKKLGDSAEKYRFASEVEIGDELYLAERNSSKVKKVRVTKTETIELYDAYAPVTYEGTIIVDGFVTSCYGTYKHENMHLLLTPLRWWYKLFESHYNIRNMMIKQMEF
ncbi:unnamed protein product [Didymodactylos carnosus]|uniref:Hint domain-containing protein n=1 Tax=Didymodactylos carnosus TaxID=1234261 RepID=A0A8S2IVK0_9BILA|nr:unnamed protein product [Didymodactylos carnosus]CAF3776957.1 unnamed protein product [Didymodactylos carnosus]